MEIKQWIDQLASSEPTPGGGGASALSGALASALCDMVCNLTKGKKKYEMYEGDIFRISSQCRIMTSRLYELIQKDADAFAPLARAYKIPKDDPTRTKVMEQALRDAATAPFEILQTLMPLPALLAELLEKGSQYAISDIGCAAVLCVGAAKSAQLNVFVNTNLMSDAKFANDLVKRTQEAVSQIVAECNEIEFHMKEIYCYE